MATKSTPKNDKQDKSGDGGKEPVTTAITNPDTRPKEIAVATDFGDMAGLGLAGDMGVAKSLLQVPNLILVSKQTDGVDDRNSPVFGHVGDFFNPITGQVYDGQKGLVGVLLYLEEIYVERKNDDQRTFVAVHKAGSPYVAAGKKRTQAENDAKPETYGFGKIIAPEGTNWLVETYTGPAVLAPITDLAKMEVDLLECFPAVLSFKSTGIPGLKKWVSGCALNRRIPGESKPRQPGEIPMCANTFRLFADPRKDGRNSWHVPLIQPKQKSIVESIELGNPDSPGAYLYQEAVALHKSLKSGAAVIDPTNIDAATAEAGEGSGSGTGGGQGGGQAAAPKKMDF